MLCFSKRSNYMSSIVSSVVAHSCKSGPCTSEFVLLNRRNITQNSIMLYCDYYIPLRYIVCFLRV
jgi:hypothetical protein